MNKNNIDKILKEDANTSKTLKNICNKNPNDIDSFLRLMFLPLDTASKLGSELRSNNKIIQESMNNNYVRDENKNYHNNELNEKKLSNPESQGNFNL